MHIWRQGAIGNREKRTRGGGGTIPAPRRHFFLLQLITTIILFKPTTRRLTTARELGMNASRRDVDVLKADGLDRQVDEISRRINTLNGSDITIQGVHGPMDTRRKLRRTRDGFRRWGGFVALL